MKIFFLCQKLTDSNELYNIYIVSYGDYLSSNLRSHDVLDANFDGLGSLSSLSLRYNSIKSITSAAFHHLKSLEYLSLDHNNIRELAPRIFYKLDKLKHLDLSHNKLLLVDEEVLKDIRNIQHISCGSCGLTNFRVVSLLA